MIRMKTNVRGQGFFDMDVKVHVDRRRLLAAVAADVRKLKVTPNSRREVLKCVGRAVRRYGISNLPAAGHEHAIADATVSRFFPELL